MKITGVYLVESYNTVSKVKEGDVVYKGDNFSLTKRDALNITRSGLIVFTIIIFRRGSHLFSHSPGKGSVSGLEDMYHLFHSFELWVNAPIIPVKLGILSRSHIVSHDIYEIQSLGLGG
jgi:hypothetical protein